MNPIKENLTVETLSGIVRTRLNDALAGARQLAGASADHLEAQDFAASIKAVKDKLKEMRAAVVIAEHAAGLIPEVRQRLTAQGNLFGGPEVVPGADAAGGEGTGG